MTLLHLFEVARFPTIVEGSFGRAIESKDGEIPVARHSCEPVATLSIGSLGAEVKVGAAIGILRWLVARAERGEWLPVRKARSILGFIERQRPEVGGGNVGGRLIL